MSDVVDFESKRRKVLDRVDDVGEVIERIDEHTIVNSDHSGIDLRCRSRKLVSHFTPQKTGGRLKIEIEYIRSREGRVALSRAWGAGIIRGRMHVQDEVKACECDSIEDSPMTASNDTMSSLQPFSPPLPTGNHCVAMLRLCSLPGGVVVCRKGSMAFNSSRAM